jgi:hypothetical protein
MELQGRPACQEVSDNRKSGIVTSPMPMKNIGGERIADRGSNATASKR